MNRILGFFASSIAAFWMVTIVAVVVGVATGGEPAWSGFAIALFAALMAVGFGFWAFQSLRRPPLKEQLLLVPHDSLLRVDHETTIEFLRAVRSGVPDRAAMAEECHALLREGRFEECIEALHELMDTYPEEDVFALTTIGECHFILGDYENSIAFFEKSADAGVGYEGMSDHISEAEEMLAADDFELVDDAMLDESAEIYLVDESGELLLAA